MVALGMTVKAVQDHWEGRLRNINNNGHRFWCEPDRSCHHVILASGRTRSNREGTKRRNHQLLFEMLAITLRKAKIKDTMTRINAAKLKVAQTKAAFQLELRNWFQALEEESVKPELSSFHQRVRETGEKILGYKQKEEGTWNIGQDHRKKTDQGTDKLT